MHPDPEPWLVIGATMTAFGIASARPRSTILVESGPIPAPEFAGAYFPGHGGETPPVSPQAVELERELIERNILHRGRYHLPALVPVLMQRLRQHRMHGLFWTDLVEISPREDGPPFQAVLFNASGRRRCTAHRVIDTRAETTAWPAPRRWTGKSLRALLHGRIAAGAPLEPGTALDWRPGRFASESTVGQTVPDGADFPEARRRLLEAWRHRPEALADVRIAAIATEFQYDCPAEPVSPVPGWIHLPSAGFANPVAAFDAGATLATEMSS